MTARPASARPTALLAFAPVGTLPSAAKNAAKPAAARRRQRAQPPSGTSSPGAPRRRARAGRRDHTGRLALSLTRSAKAALARRRLKLSKVGFAFTLNAPARVRVTIYRRVRVHGRMLCKRCLVAADDRRRRRRAEPASRAAAPRCAPGATA